MWRQQEIPLCQCIRSAWSTSDKSKQISSGRYIEYLFLISKSVWNSV